MELSKYGIYGVTIQHSKKNLCQSTAYLILVLQPLKVSRCFNAINLASAISHQDLLSIKAIALGEML